MTTINLCQITELNKDYKNVYDFNSRAEQLAFMTSKLILSLETNARIDNFTTNITLNYGMNSNIRKCDYLFTQGIDGKYLFFFLDNIEQVTTSTVKLYLTLDVWMTYHLDIQLKPSYVIRQHVPRWKSNGYPTDEFVSEGGCSDEYILESRTTISNAPTPTNGVYIYYTSTPIGITGKEQTNQTGGSSHTPTTGCGDVDLGIPTPNGFLFIKGYEGLAQYAYNIGDGVMTIGYGCTDAYDTNTYHLLKQNEPVSDELASQYFAESLVSNYGVPLKNSLASDNLKLSSQEFDAVLSFVYNAGLGSWKRSAIRTHLLTGDKEGAYNAWLTQNIMEGTQFEEGLRARRQAEANIFKNGEYELRTITIYGQGGAVTGRVESSESFVPFLISNKCSGGSTSYQTVTDARGNQWVLPLEKGWISALYGSYPGGGKHYGIDFTHQIRGEIKGANIYAPKDGMQVVTATTGTTGFGNYVTLFDSKTQTYHILGHMNEEPLVNVGDIVTTETVLGHVGTSGNSSGYHLHWEIRYQTNSSSYSFNPISNATLNTWYYRNK